MNKALNNLNDDLEIEEPIIIDRKPRFDIINKYTVAIKSLRNQLKRASGIDELTYLAGKILELENKIMIEKSIGYRELEETKKATIDKIDKLQRDLAKAESELSQIDTKLDIKLNSYRKKIQEKIESLNTEYTSLLSSAFAKNLACSTVAELS